MTSNVYSKLFLLLFCVSATDLAAQESSKEHLLDSISVVGHYYTSPLRGVGTSTLRWQMTSLGTMPQTLGNADPLRYSQLLPGVQTNSDFDAGLHIFGCDNAHNSISIDGIPVYNPTHLLGLFSTFPATQFQEMQLNKAASSAWMPNRLGGIINMQSHTVTDSLSGSLSVGLLSTQATLHLPTGSKSSLTTSVRTSYINLLYSSFFKVDDSQIEYRFSDLNLSWTWEPSLNDQLLLSAYYGGDQLTLQEDIGSHLKWGNRLAGLIWRHVLPEGFIRCQTYYTHFNNQLNLDESAYHLDTPSSISDFSANAQLSFKQLTLSADYIYHDIQPVNQPRQQAHETSLSADWRQSITDRMQASVGIKVSDYLTTGSASHNWMAADPIVTLQYQASYGGTWLFTYSSRHQYLQQSSISQLGLPIEFWFSSTPQVAPQHAHSFTLSHDQILANPDWQLTTELFCKLLSHQKEFIGTGLGFATDTDYQLVDQLIEGDGQNYGIDLILNKRSGRLTGWVACTLSRAMRHFSGLKDSFPASHERRYELNTVATYQLSSCFNLSGTFVYADGNPFTAPEYFYLFNGRYLTHFASYNDNRLPAYHRLDMALTWHQKLTRRVEQSLNLSVYNVYAQKNASYYRLKIYQGNYGYRPLCLMGWPLPSLSYSLKF